MVTGFEAHADKPFISHLINFTADSSFLFRYWLLFYSMILISLRWNKSRALDADVARIQKHDTNEKESCWCDWRNEHAAAMGADHVPATLTMLTSLQPTWHDPKGANRLANKQSTGLRRGAVKLLRRVAPPPFLPAKKKPKFPHALDLCTNLQLIPVVSPNKYHSVASHLMELCNHYFLHLS